MKFLILVCDGLGDRPDKKGKTPLEAASTLNMDAFAKDGITGMLDPIQPGIVPGSDTAHLSLLGFDPYEVYMGRGPYEALGAGVNLKEGDVCFRTNFATQDNKTKKIIDRRAGRISGNLKELVQLINEIKLPCDFEFRQTVDHRGVLVLHGKGLSEKVIPTDPHKIDVSARNCVPTAKAKEANEFQEAKKTSQIVNMFIQKANVVLNNAKLNQERKAEGNPPANSILLRALESIAQEKLLRMFMMCAGAVLLEPRL